MAELDHCQECSSPPEPGSRRCRTCKDHHNLREAARRQARRDAGLCVRCGETAVVDDDGEPMSYCDGCRAANDARRLALKKQRARARLKARTVQR